jgi:hypothetical protein
MQSVSQVVPPAPSLVPEISIYKAKGNVGEVVVQKNTAEGDGSSSKLIRNPGHDGG